MKEVLLGIVLVFASVSFGQGLNAELGFNDDYSQNAKAVVAFEDFSIFAKEQTLSASFFTRSSIIKIDTLGNELWDIPVFPQNAEVVQITEMIPSENNGIYLLGYARPTCDVSGGCFWFLQKIDGNGILEWQREWNDQVCFGVSMSGITLTQNDALLVHYNDPLVSIIYTLDTNGNDVTSIQPTDSGFRGTEQLSGFHSIAFKQFSLFGFDGIGTITAQKTYPSFIKDAVAWNDSLYVVTEDSIFIYDNNLQGLAAQDVPAFTNFSQLKVRDADVRLISTSTTGINRLRLDKNLALSEAIFMALPDPANQPLDYHNEHLSIAMDFALSEYTTIRFLDFSLKETTNISVNRTDIGIIDIQITQSSITPNPNFNAVFEVEIGADVLLKNFGNEILENCRMNHYVSPALACGLIYYGEEFFNLNLAPGDSVWVPLGIIHTDERSFPNDSLNQEICIYTSFSNSVTDLNIANDRTCTTVTFGTASIGESIQTEKQLLRSVDLLGREVKNPKNQWVINQYSNGTSEMIFVGQ